MKRPLCGCLGYAMNLTLYELKRSGFDNAYCTMLIGSFSCLGIYSSDGELYIWFKRPLAVLNVVLDFSGR